MFTINKSKIQTDTWRIQIFKDELYIAGQDMQLNLQINDLTMEDRIQRFVLISPEHIFLFVIEGTFQSYNWSTLNAGIMIHQPTSTSIIQPQSYSYTGRNRVEKTITINFKRDDYWKVRTWFMKLLNEIIKDEILG